MANILVIDDIKEQRMIVRKSLEMEGHSVLEAENGEQGLRLARSSLPDLVLTDVVMDEGDGYGFLASLRNDPRLTNIPVILMTGLADLRGLRQGMNLGADDYLPKPFTLEELIKAVNSRLQKSAAMRRQAERNFGELRGQISLLLSHELLTPLSGILGIADIIRQEAETLTPEQLTEYAGSLQESGERLHRLILNCLTYAQMEILASSPDLVDNMRKQGEQCTEEVISFRAREEAQNARRMDDLVLELAHLVIPVSAANLEKVVAELLSNAFKFSQPGTQVWVRLVAADGEMRLTIADQGRGMNPESLAQIGAYVQFNRKIYEQQGAGLGLIIAKRMVELHGGRFEIYSREGHGTTITIHLPLPGKTS